jgi:ADP-heptose:LPS heptosyltransferase
MKKRLKDLVASSDSLLFLMPFIKRTLRCGYAIRDIFWREILRLRLLVLRISFGRPLLLFVRFGGIGDILCSLPAYEAACKDSPLSHGVYITLAEFKSLPELARSQGSICSSRRHCSIPQLPRWIVSKTFEPNYTDEIGKESSHRHLSEEFFVACNLSVIKKQPVFFVNDSKIEQIKKLTQLSYGEGIRIIVLQTGPSWKVREWPIDHWQKLVDKLHESMSVRILQIGANQHVTIGKVEVVGLNAVESLVGKLSLEEMAALLTISDLFIGIDSGMLHMAGAAGTPCVGIFGPTNPDLRMPQKARSIGVFHQLPCSFCHHHQPRLHFQENCPYGIACMNLLQVDQVLEACLTLLETTSAINPTNTLVS